MPKERLNIKGIQRGMLAIPGYSNSEAFALLKNVDNTIISGGIRGFKGKTLTNLPGATPQFKKVAFMSNVNDKVDMFFFTGTAIGVIEDWYNARILKTNLYLCTSCEFMPYSNRMYCITDNGVIFFTRLGYERFTDNVDMTLRYFNATVNTFNKSTMLKSDSTGDLTEIRQLHRGTFLAGDIVEVGLTLVYDGIEESIPVLTSSKTIKEDGEHVVALYTLNYDNIPLNVTDIVIYTRLTREGYTGQWYRVKETSIIGKKNKFWKTNPIVSAILGDNYKGTYEDLNGYNEEFSNTVSNYKVAEVFGNSMFVAGGTVKGLPEAEMLVFRSEPGQPNVFDTLTKFFKPQDKVTAMKGYNNRLYVFDNKNLYYVNPYDLTIDDIMEGAGIPSQRQVTRSLDGIYWYNDNAVYFHNGNNIQTITDYFNLGDKWHGLNSYDDTGIVYDSINRNIIIYFKVGTTLKMFAFNIVTKLWTTLEETGALIFDDFRNNVYLYTGSSLYEMFTNSSRLSWELETYPMVIGLPNETKKFYEVRIKGNGTAFYKIDNEANWQSVTAEKLIPYQKGKKIALRVTGTGICENITLVYRKLIGVR